MNNIKDPTDRSDKPHNAESAPNAIRYTLFGLAGASVEWYDFLLYATAAAIVFPQVFFPESLPPIAGLIASFSTFAVGYIARPIGAAVFGHIGDKLGRKMAFAVALIVMGSATTLVGCLPPYRIAGVLSPLALVALRLIQGVAVGGQWGGAILLAIENAPSKMRGLYGSIAQMGLPVGILLANLALLIANAVTSTAGFVAYGWRIPFLLSVVLIGLGLLMHFGMPVSPDEEHLRDDGRRAGLRRSGSAGSDAPRHERMPLLEAAREYPGAILLAAGANVGVGVTLYILITYAVGYGTSIAGLGLSRATMLGALLVAQAACVPFIAMAGALSDRFGRLRVYMIGTGLSGIWIFAFFPLVETRSFLWVTVAMSVGLSFFALSYGPTAALYAELFSKRVRYSAVSLTYQISAIIGGGLGPVIAAALYARYHSNMPVSIFVGLACACSLLCAQALKQTAVGACVSESSI